MLASKLILPPNMPSCRFLFYILSLCITYLLTIDHLSIYLCVGHTYRFIWAAHSHWYVPAGLACILSYLHGLMILISCTYSFSILGHLGPGSPTFVVEDCSSYIYIPNQQSFHLRKTYFGLQNIV
ncbi:hypothetical protein F5879DRAFT_161054 [Lentinula edodes]|nr:hypothetical protein F5879DRAFT_161054 [Lentinula edodes]